MKDTERENDVGLLHYLLRGPRIVFRFGHVEVDVLKRGALSNLPVDAADFCSLTRRPQIDDKVTYTAEEIVRVEVPASPMFSDDG